MKLITGILTTNSMNKSLLLLSLIGIFLISCKKGNEVDNEVKITVPVTLTTIDTTGVSSFTDLNATATYLVKTIIKANATGYLNTVNVASNDFVTSGKVLFTLKTREAKVLVNTINKIDPTLNFGMPIPVYATSNGYVNSVNVQQGNYVQDGDILATINDANSFAIVLSLPYELKKYVSIGRNFEAILPDGTLIKTCVKKFMSSVDATSQTQNVILKVIGKCDIPENLILKVRIPKACNLKGISLPKEAVLSNETETAYWIMKLINDTIAIKIPIKKGIEAGNKVEITAPKLTLKDRILLTGNYGVPDTINVKIVKN